ncbi:secretion system protein [Xylanimonas allomyrinae]|uniref:Secretion system protein n=1 Tax=Xylanimonas allomyrinae TaxID=2509459 RepID=A0A4P6EPR1_9MICO|nr:secretion system protein [Xylanimonas allomyrinae]
MLAAAGGLAAATPWLLASAATRRRCARLGAAPPAARDAVDGLGIEVTVVLELLGAALGAGAGVPRALQATGDAVGGIDGVALRAVAASLRLGAPWTEAWGGVPPRLEVVGHALRPAWEEGAAPGAALRAASDELRRSRRDAARLAAGRLAVRLVLPLGACFLPAFVLVGLVPVLLALGVGLLGR